MLLTSTLISLALAADSKPEYSGMAWMEQDKKLLVAAGGQGLFIVDMQNVVPGSPTPVTIDPQSKVKVPSDAEAVARVPGSTANEPKFLVASGKPRQVYLLGFKGGTLRSSDAVALRLPGPNRGDIEGLAFLKFGDADYLFVGERGGDGSPGRISAWAWADGKAPKLVGYRDVDAPMASTDPTALSGCDFEKRQVTDPRVGARAISELLADGGRLRVAAATDPGDAGPFYSCVYDVTPSLNLKLGAKDALTLTTAWVWNPGGAATKVEALAMFADRTFIYGTDNEDGTSRICPLMVDESDGCNQH